MIGLKKLALVVALSGIVGGLAATSAFAQTGPINPTPPAIQPGGTGPTTGPVNPMPGGSGPVQPGAVQPAAPQGFTEVSLGQYLRSKGYQVKEEKLPDGQTRFLTTIEKAGWRFAVEIHLSKDLKTVYFHCHLGNPISPGAVTADQLLRVLDASMTQFRNGFAYYRPADRRLMFYDWCANNPQAIEQRLNADLEDVVKTFAVWNVVG